MDGGRNHRNKTESGAHYGLLLIATIFITGFTQHRNKKLRAIGQIVRVCMCVCACVCMWVCVCVCEVGGGRGGGETYFLISFWAGLCHCHPRTLSLYQTMVICNGVTLTILDEATIICKYTPHYTWLERCSSK